MKATPEYKCRRCGKTIQDYVFETSQDAQDIAEEVMEWIDDRPYFSINALIDSKNIEDYKIYYSSAHVCNDGGVGRTDFIGVKLEE